MKYIVSAIPEIRWTRYTTVSQTAKQDGILPIHSILTVLNISQNVCIHSWIDWDLGS